MRAYSDAETNNIFRARFEAEYGYDPLDPQERETYESCGICGDETDSETYCDSCRQTVIDDLRRLKDELKTDWETLWDVIDFVWEDAVEGGER